MTAPLDPETDRLAGAVERRLLDLLPPAERRHWGELARVRPDLAARMRAVAVTVRMGMGNGTARDTAHRVIGMAEALDLIRAELAGAVDRLSAGLAEWSEGRRGG